MKKILLMFSTALLLSAQAEARRGDGDKPRPETISCNLTFAREVQSEAQQSVLVQNGQALLRGEARGVSYVFSVRGKTAVARLTDSAQSVTAQGAIEMLRHGGETRTTENTLTPRRRGEDDANDGTPEREAGFQLSLAPPQSPTLPDVTLKCESVNQTQNDNGD